MNSIIESAKICTILVFEKRKIVHGQLILRIVDRKTIGGQIIIVRAFMYRGKQVLKLLFYAIASSFGCYWFHVMSNEV